MRPAVLSSVAMSLAAIVAGCGGSSTPTANGKARSQSIDPNAPEVVAPGDIPDTQVFVTYTAAGYSFKVPEGWSQSVDGATTTFTDHYNTVVASSSSTGAAPTISGVRATEVPMLRHTVSSFQLRNVGSVTRTGGPAVVVSYRSGSTPDPVTGKRVALDVERYEFWRNGTQVTLTLSGARGSDNVDPWKTITNSLTWPA